jgi:protein-L-isoaspartate(D-aspartate) O-methyltransferase
MDFNLARVNMVQQQVRTWDVLDPRILDLLSTIPREPFVLPAFKALAYSDAFLPIGFNQVILQAKIVGRLLQALNIKETESVLEIGTGTGYITALLCLLAKKVASIEIIAELSFEAKHHLKSLDLQNVTLEVGNGIEGCPVHGPYDVIVLTGSVPLLAKALREQLSIKGRLFAVTGQAPAMSAILITRVDKELWKEKVLFETDIPPLLHGPESKTFTF